MSANRRPLLVLSAVFALTLAAVLLAVASAPINAAPLEQGSNATFTLIPTDTAGGTFTLISQFPPNTNFPPPALMEVDRNGNPAILFQLGDRTILMRCSTPTCSGNSTNQLPTLYYTDMALQPVAGGSDVPVLLYQPPDFNEPRRLDRCSDALCTNLNNLATVNAFATPGAVVAPTQGPLSANILFPSPRTFGLLNCSGSPCQSSVVGGSVGNAFLDISLELVSSIPVMAYYTVDGLVVARCEAPATCNAPTINVVVPFDAQVGFHRFEMTINAAGNPVIVHYDAQLLAGQRLYVATCGDPACQTVTDRPLEQMFDSTYRVIEADVGASGDLYAAYDRIDWQQRTPTESWKRYLMLRRCRLDTLNCTLRNLVTLETADPAYSRFVQHLGEVEIRGERAYILFLTGARQNGATVYSIRLYVGNQPGIPTPTPIPTITWTPTSAANAAPQRNRFENERVPLTWQHVSDAATYQVQVARNAAFTQMAYEESALPSTQLSLVTPPLGDGTYFWRVRATLNTDEVTNWSAVDTFVILRNTHTPTATASP